MGHHGYTYGAQDADGGYLQIATPGGIARPLNQQRGHYDDDTDTLLVGAPADAPRVRAADGLARRLDDRPDVVNALDQRRGGPDDNEAQAGHIVEGGHPGGDDVMLPPGLDSHRYRCCGNGVVASVAEWIGTRLAEVFA
jgi:hypothetical protein